VGVGLLVAGVTIGSGPVAAVEANAARTAHAKLTGSEPADGTVLDETPAAVSLSLDAKPATVEGDPLRVYAPGGARIDDRHASVSDRGRRITVRLLPTVVRPAGRYEIVYRIVSADTHLIAGRLEFSARAAVPPLAGLKGEGSAGGAAANDRLVHGWPEDPRPVLVAALAVAFMAGRLAWRRRRAARRVPEPLPLPVEARSGPSWPGSHPGPMPGRLSPRRPVATAMSTRSHDPRNGHARAR
jgi:methionine-rich copper-binding protein CopC